MQCNTIRQLLHGTITTDSTGMKARVWAVLARLGALSVGKKDKAHNFYQFSRFVCISWFFFLLTGGPLPCLLASFTGSDLCVRVGCPMDCVRGGGYAVQRFDATRRIAASAGTPVGLGAVIALIVPAQGRAWTGLDRILVSREKKQKLWHTLVFFSFSPVRQSSLSLISPG